MEIDNAPEKPIDKNPNAKSEVIKFQKKEFKNREVEQVEIDNKNYVHFYRGTSLENLKKNNDGNYLDHSNIISFTSKKKIAEEMAEINHDSGYTPVIMDVLVPIDKVEDKRYGIMGLPTLSNQFSYGMDAEQEEFSTIFKLPLSWMKGYWDKEGKYIANPVFNPTAPTEKVPISAMGNFSGVYEKYLPEELEEFNKVLSQQKQ